MHDDELEPAELQEVIKVVTTAKLIREVVTAATTIITAASSTARRRIGVVIRDPEETATPSTIIHFEPKPKDKGKGIMVKRKEKEDNTVLRYQALKRKPQTEAHAKKNMIVYLKNMARFKMYLFKGMSYDAICPIFEKYFNSNVAFLEKTKEQLEEEKSRALKRKTKSSKEKAIKKQKLDEELVGNKMHKAFPLPVMEFLLPEEVPTASEESSHCQKKNNATAMKIALLLKSRRNCQSNSYDSFANKYKTAQELWAAILKTFGGNEATKKTKKDLLKQQYGNFKAEGSKTLEQTFNRLSDLDTMNLDDLYNYLKVYESKVQKKLEPNSQNMAFISLAKHSSGNEEVNIASGSISSINVSTASVNIGVATISQDTACTYIASQSSGKKISIQGTDMIGFDKLKVECFNCHKMGHFSRECRAPRSQDRGRRENYRQGSKVKEQAPKALMAINRVGWDWSYMNMIYHYKLGLAQVEARLAEHRSQELKYCEKIRVLEFKTESGANCIESLTKDLELLKKERGDLETKLTGFQTILKDLDSLLESQRLDKNKEGLGYSVVPPPPTQIYSPPKKDMSWTGLPEFKDDTVTNYSRPSPAIESTSDNAQNRNPSEASPSTISPKPFTKFVKVNDSSTKNKTDKVKIAKKPPVNKMMKKGTSRSQNNTHKSFTPRPVVHKPYRPPMRPMRSNMNATRPNKTSFNKPSHSYTKRPFQRTSAVRSQYRGPRVPPVSRNFSTVNRKFPTANKKFPTGGIKFSTADMGKKKMMLRPQRVGFESLHRTYL
nr:hypothetical protein [Tanacetum cinerariifolium]